MKPLPLICLAIASSLLPISSLAQPVNAPANSAAQKSSPVVQQMQHAKPLLVSTTSARPAGTKAVAGAAVTGGAVASSASARPPVQSVQPSVSQPPVAQSQVVPPKPQSLAMPMMVRGSAAAQTLRVTPNSTTTATVSLRELSRIAIEGAKIDIVDTRAGAAEINHDKNLGELRLIPPENDPRPINLFVTSDSGHTYTLLLIVEDTPAQTIVLQEQQPPLRKVSNRAEASSRPTAGADYERLVKTLMLSMARNEATASTDVVARNVEFGLWNEAKFVLQYSFMTKQLVGEVFSLTNTSRETMVLAEQEFFKPGVVAISFEHATLNAGTSTSVYIVRERSPNE
jgi:conjugal transfer pilus assembly protein TraK